MTHVLKYPYIFFLQYFIPSKDVTCSYFYLAQFLSLSLSLSHYFSHSIFLSFGLSVSVCLSLSLSLSLCLPPISLSISLCLSVDAWVYEYQSVWVWGDQIGDCIQAEIHGLWSLWSPYHYQRDYILDVTKYVSCIDYNCDRYDQISIILGFIFSGTHFIT